MKLSVHFIATVLLGACVFVQAEPTFADLAVLLAKGPFKEHVRSDASLEECAAFLNNHGVYFSLFDLMDPARRVTKEDFARVMGQTQLLFLGDAEVVGGFIKRPNKSVTWVDYCLLNDVTLSNLWKGFLQRTAKGSLPEVNRFFEGM